MKEKRVMVVESRREEREKDGEGMWNGPVVIWLAGCAYRASNGRSGVRITGSLIREPRSRPGSRTGVRFWPPAVGVGSQVMRNFPGKQADTLKLAVPGYFLAS